MKKKVNIPNEMRFSAVMNREFRVKVHGCGYHTLVGWSGLVGIIGQELAEKAVLKAFSSKTDKWSWRLRRGLKLDFYAK